MIPGADLPAPASDGADGPTVSTAEDVQDPLAPNALTGGQNVEDPVN